MSYTMKQLSNELNISRPGVINRMNQVPNFKEKYTYKAGNKIIVNEDGAQILFHENGGVRKNFSNSNSDVTDSKSDITAVIAKNKMLKTLLGNAQNSNKQLQKQLNHANSANDRLGALLSHQQELEITAEHDNQRLRTQNKHLRAISGPINKNTSNSKTNAEKPKLSFWQKLFGKH